MKILSALFLISLFIFGCSDQSADELNEGFGQILASNLQNMPYAALTRITAAEIDQEIRTDKGDVGYVILKVRADVLETFKGDIYDQITWYEWCEAPADLNNLINHTDITCLEYSEKDNRYYIPDNGCRIPAAKSLLKAARSYRQKHEGEGGL